MDWKKIMTKYDGILFENTNCSSSEIPKKTKPNYKKLLMLQMNLGIPNFSPNVISENKKINLMRYYLFLIHFSKFKKFLYKFFAL